ncbi:MAG: hypothetical protein IKB60_03395 [Clostridia bacterium]|nr:hypothetical protein [Clostridia bacterium]
MKVKRFCKLMCAFVVVCLIGTMLMSIAAFAAPETLPGDVTSTKAGLVSLKVPQQIVSTTTNETLAISATAPQGTTVTVYRFNTVTGEYNKVYLNEAPVEAVVGPTMLFAGQVELSHGMNKFIIRGESPDGNSTVVRFEVTLLNKGFMERIKSLIDFHF